MLKRSSTKALSVAILKLCFLKLCFLKFLFIYFLFFKKVGSFVEFQLYRKKTKNIL